jgi:superfamily I DNA/RNA helicase
MESSEPPPGKVPLPRRRRLPETLSNRARLAVAGFFELLTALREMAGSEPADGGVAALLDRSGLLAQYGAADEEDRSRRANLDQLVAAAAEAVERGSDLTGFMDEVALLTDADQRASGQAVSSPRCGQGWVQAVFLAASRQPAAAAPR